MGSAAGMNSDTTAVTLIEFPSAAEPGGAEDVKTKMPSEVDGFASAFASGVWRKKPLLRNPVTIPVVVMDCPTKGEVFPLP